MRATKYDINDDDFLINSIDSINFSETESWLSEHESFRVLFNALKNLGIGEVNTSSAGSQQDSEVINISEDYFDEDFQNEWA